MRTTVDLDADLLERLRVEAAKQRVSFKQLLNAAIRIGLAQRPASASKAYVLPVRQLGAVREGVDLTKALRLVDELENAEVTAELERRK
jgi:hypothetical protein